VFDVFPKDVDQADARGKVINGDQIDILATRVRDSDKRMDAVNRTTSNASQISTIAVGNLFETRPPLCSLATLP